MQSFASCVSLCLVSLSLVVCTLALESSSTSVSPVDATTSTSTSTTTGGTDETTEGIEITGQCYIKAWGAVATCRPDFINKIEGKEKIGKCCLYNMLTQCANLGARKLCGESTEYATAKWLAKYHAMIDFENCERVDTNSFTCFWISWENYVSVFLFLVVTVIMIIYVANWYAKGGIGKV